MNRYWWLVLVLLVGLLGAVGYQQWQRHWQAPLGVETPRLLTVKQGEYASHLVRRLARDGLVTQPLTVKLWLKLRPQLARIKAGTYELSPGMSLSDLFAKLVAGDEKQFAITLVEGLQWRQWKQQLLADTRLSSDNFSELQLLKQLKPEGGRFEGWLMPDTYHFTYGTPVADLIHRAYERMQQAVEMHWAGRQTNLPLNNPYEALILASIVEKETALAEERPLIAGVFVNRLRKNMRLQTDPTVIYGLGENFDGDIRSRDLRRKTPYNTYVIRGLPPTPIAMVSEASLKASLQPKDTDALYFVARNDGSHVFSTNLADHNDAVRKYQLNQD